MLAGQIELILFITGLATTGALVLSLAPVTMMKMLFGQAPPIRSVSSSPATGGCWLAWLGLCSCIPLFTLRSASQR